jgi:hypothetical protein
MNASDGGCQYLTIQNAEQVELPRGRSAVTRTLCKITRHANGIAWQGYRLSTLAGFEVRRSVAILVPYIPRWITTTR